MYTETQIEAIRILHEPHLEDLLIYGLRRGYYVSLGLHTGIGYNILFYGNIDAQDIIIPYNVTLPLLDQPNLEEIISFIKKIGTG